MNNIRLYLKVSRLSDIATSTGDGIREDIFNGILGGESTLDWPKQRKPIQQNLNTWKKVLIEIFQATTGLYPKNLGPDLPCSPTQQFNKRNLLSYLHSYPSYYQSLLGNFSPTRSDYEIILNWMAEGNLYAGSDGSVSEGIGTHSFCFTDGKNKSIIIGGSAPTPGNSREITSLRTELAGALCLLLIIHAIQQVSGQDMQSVTLWIDNAEVLRRFQEPDIQQSWNDTMVLDFDLWREIILFQKKIKVPLVF